MRWPEGFYLPFANRHTGQFGNATAHKSLRPMKHFLISFVSIGEEKISCMWRSKTIMIPVTKQPPLLEDLRNHSQEQISELRQLLLAGAPTNPDPRRPGFFEVQGVSNTYYVFKYPTGTKVLLLAVWERDPVAEMVAYSCPAA